LFLFGTRPARRSSIRHARRQADPRKSALGRSVPGKDTFGLPPCTPMEQEWKFATSNVDGPALLCARSQAEWAVAWILYGPGADPVPPVDFERFMVVGLLKGRGDPSRVIYRIELDDTANPSALTVRCARHDSVSL